MPGRRLETLGGGLANQIAKDAGKSCHGSWAPHSVNGVAKRRQADETPNDSPAAVHRQRPNCPLRLTAQATARLRELRLLSGVNAALLLLLAHIANAQLVRGVVVERGSGIPLAGVLVSLEPYPSAVRDERAAATNGLTNARGEFAVRALGAGRYRLTAKRIGVRRFSSEAFQIAAGELVHASPRCGKRSIPRWPPRRSRFAIARRRPRSFATPAR